MGKFNSSIFIDSNFFIALNNPSDSLHLKAKQASGQLLNENINLFITNMIFLEVVTILSQRTNRNFAIKVGKKLLIYEHFIMIDNTIQERSWEIFQEIDKKNMGFIDCSILAVMEKESIDTLLTFDFEDFHPLQRKYNFKLYPD